MSQVLTERPFLQSYRTPIKRKSDKDVRKSRAQGQASESPKVCQNYTNTSSPPCGTRCDQKLSEQDDKVQEALKRAQEGMATAESSLSNIEHLPSNKVQKPSPVRKHMPHVSTENVTHDQANK